MIFDEKQLQDWGVISWGYTCELNALSFDHYSEWIDRGDHAQMKYLADERMQKRQSLSFLYPQAQSALVFLFDYGQAKVQWEKKTLPSEHKIAGFVIGFDGIDYHILLQARLKQILNTIQKSYADIDGVIALDTSPVLERDLAYRAGLGWFGKNSMLINQKHGSNFIIGSIILNRQLPLLQMPVESDHCGHCQRCSVACPTQAIDPITRTIQSDRCLSYYTIEIFKQRPPMEGHEKSNGEIFGCDICQDVCPWTVKAQRSYIEDDRPLAANLEKYKQLVQTPTDKLIAKIESLSLGQFKMVFKGSSIERTGKKGLLKNLSSWKERSENHS